MSLNIWIFNPYDPLPQEEAGELRYGRLSRELAGQGHVVTWWSVDWSHTLKRRRSCGMEAEKAGQQFAETGGGSPAITERVSTQLISVPAYRRNISLRRVWSHWCYARGIAKHAQAHVAKQGKPDVILFSVPPMETGAVALKLRRKYGARVVLDVMDAWPEVLQQAAAMAGGRWRMANAVLRWAGAVALWPYYRLMRRYCREADGVCAQSEAFALHALTKGAKAGPAVFYLGGSRRQRPDGPPAREILYLGAMGQVYDLATVVEAGALLKQRGVEFRMHLVGEGTKRPALQQQVARLGLQDCIALPGYLSGEALEQVFSRSGIGLIPMSPDSQVAVPYKAGDYLGAGLAVINSLPGELAELIRQHDCGTCYRHGDASQLADALGDLLTQPARLAAQQTNARRLFEEKFDHANIYPAFARWLGESRKAEMLKS